MTHWSKHQVQRQALKLEGVDDKTAWIPFNEANCKLLDITNLKKQGVTSGPAKILIHARDETIQGKRLCKPYPFNKYEDTYRYIESDLLDLTESGALNFIEPCHEYKAFTKTTEETRMIKFSVDIIRFAAACINSRTNGTIHFGIGDKPHGEVLGVPVGEDREIYDKMLRASINRCFEFKHKEMAQICIKPPRFVEVLCRNMTVSGRFVIEVDIVSYFEICKDNIFHTYSIPNNKGENASKAKPKPTKQFFVREGGSSRNLLAPTTFAKPFEEYKRFVKNVEKLSKLRGQAEEEHLKLIKTHKQGSKLCQMITGGTGSLDKSYYDQCIIVTNKSHLIQFDSMGFIVDLNPIAVLDFDPQSASGLKGWFEKQSPVTPHLPDKYKITEPVKDIAEKLQLTRSTSWVFCNGGIGDEQPSEVNHWLLDKGASVRNVISFLCRKDVLQNKKILVAFLLLSRVSDKMDPLIETFCTFYKELKGTEQVLCICDNENAFTSWKNLIEARCEVDISSRCIYELSLAEVNGTVLSLLSKNRRSSHFLPGGGGSKVVLEKRMARSLYTLDILCINQCEGGNEDQILIEQNFYKGGKVSWWNFYFSEQPGSVPFIKRDKFVYIIDTLIPDLCTLRKACVRFNLNHVPGCGGTTLAKHTLWALRERFRCAVLIDNSADLAEVAEHVVTLLKCGVMEHVPPLPVLLMIDDFDDMDKVFNLQQLIEKQCMESNVQSRSAQVILLNCMRSSQQTSGPNDPTDDTVFIGNELSENEQKQFDHKLAEVENL